MMIGNTNTVADNLYYLLWIKDSGLQESKFPVRIPDTILINGRQISNWYFTNSNDQVLKKKVNHLNPQSIYDSFTNQNAKSGIVAQIIKGESNSEKLTMIQKKANKTHLLQAGEEEKVFIKYLNEEELYQYLFVDLNHQDLDEVLILQKFIDPYGESNNCVQAIWSPSTCMFIKRVNNRKLNDKQYEPYERAVTFDGPEIFSKAVCLKGKQVSGEIRRLCEYIVKRIAHVTYERTMINRMTLYFKADRNNKLYFLYCTSLRLKDENKNIVQKRQLEPEKYPYNNTPLVLDNNFLRPPNIKNVYSIYTTRPMRLENDLVCLSCDNMYQLKDMMEIPFSYLMRFESSSSFTENQYKSPGFENTLLEQLNNQQKLSSGRGKKKKQVEVLLTNRQIMNFMNESSPDEPFNLDKIKLFVDSNHAPPHPLLAKLYPKMTKENYAQFKQKGNFDSLNIKLCHNCYYYYTQNQVITGAPLFPQENATEIKRNLVNKNSHLFNPEIQKVVLQKNLELSKEFDYVKYLNPTIYEQRLDLLQRNDAFLKYVQPPSSKQKKDYTDSANKDYRTQQNDLANSRIQSGMHSSRSELKSQSQKSIKKINDIPLFESNKEDLKIKDFFVIDGDNTEHKKGQMVTSPQRLISTDRPKTTSTNFLMKDSEQYKKRFNHLLNLAQKGASKHKNNQEKRIISSQKASSQQGEQFEKELLKGEKNDQMVKSQMGITHHTSKYTSTTNDDSFSKKKDSVLEIYLNAYEEKQKQFKENQNPGNSQEKEVFTNRMNSPVASAFRQETPDKSITLSTYDQNEKNQKDSLNTRKLSSHVKLQLANSKNETGSYSLSPHTYRSSVQSSFPYSARDKFITKQGNSINYHKSQSYSKKKIDSGRGQGSIPTQGSSSTIQTSHVQLDYSTRSMITRPNTTQNAMSHLHTIQESGGQQNRASFKALKSPYLPFKTFRQLKQPTQHNLEENPIHQIAVGEINSFGLANQRNLKAYTSHSQRIKLPNKVNIGSISSSQQMGKNKRNIESPIFSKNVEEHQKNEIYFTESTANQFTTSNLNASLSQQHSPNMRKLDIGGGYSQQTVSNQNLLTHRSDEQQNPTDLLLSESKENNKPTNQIDINSNSYKEGNQENPSSQHSLAKQHQINKYFNTEEQYQKEIQNIVQDYNDQKE